MKNIQYTDDDFLQIQLLAKKYTGITLGDSKKNMIYARLCKRVRQCGEDSFARYLDRVCKLDNPETESFINAITTNLTSIFREPHHFSFLSEQITTLDVATAKLRIWSAGCSSGEEVCSLLITLDQFIDKGLQYRILATDLDSNVLERASKGVYTEEKIQGLSQQQKKRNFDRGVGEHLGLVRLKPEKTDWVTYQQLNLAESWPHFRPFDFIFCRNVMIYFDKDLQKKIVNKFADRLDLGGFLFLGHSESLLNSSKRFRLVGRTIYQKIS